MDMRDIIKKILKEYDDPIQKISFDGFSDPVLIPQYNMFIVKFLGTGKYDKISDIEKIMFKDNNGKEFLFNADDIQKTGSSPFYIKLDTLRRYYDVRFNDDFEKQKITLSKNEYHHMLSKLRETYVSEGRCKNNKCEELRDVIEKSLKEIYGNKYGKYTSTNCEPTFGFMNIYALNNTKDDKGNYWSKLNYIVTQENPTITLLMNYLKEYGTFEHGDFIEWVYNEKDRLFNGPFLELMIRNLNIPSTDKTFGKDVLSVIKKVFPNSKVVDSFCPSDTDFMVIDIDGKNKIIQPVATKSKRVLNHNGKYYIFFGRRGGSPEINRDADYFVIPDGPVFKNTNVIKGDRAWEFSDPPIYYELDFDTTVERRHKMK